jgi:hypothetical protein
MANPAIAALRLLLLVVIRMCFPLQVGTLPTQPAGKEPGGTAVPVLLLAKLRWNDNAPAWFVPQESVMSELELVLLMYVGCCRCCPR